MWRVLQLAPYRRLVVTSLLNELASSIGSVALALLVYRRTGSAIGATAFFLCAQFAPAILSPFFVARLDQRTARLVLAALYVVEAVVFAVLAWVAHHFSLASVLALALVDGTLALTARVLSRAAWTPVTSAAGLLREGNAVLNTGYSVLYMVGPAIAGVLVALVGTVATLLVNVGVFAVVAVVAGTTRGLPRAASERAPSAGRLRAALEYVRGDVTLRNLLLLQAVGIAFFTLATPVEVVFAQRSLHAGAGGYGALLSVWGAGAIAGSLVYARWRALPSRTLITAGTVSVAIGFLVMAVAPSLGVALVGAAIGGLGNGMGMVAARTALQELAPERWLALLVGLNESIFYLMPGIGFLIGGGIAALAGPRAALAVGAAGSVAVAAAVWVKLRAALAPAEVSELVALPNEVTLEATAGSGSPRP